MYSALRFWPAVFRKARPIQLTFFLTRRCNADCPFCFYLRSRRPLGGGQPELSLAEIDRVAASLGPMLWILFGGGETFLREDLEAVSLSFYRHCRPSVLTYTTNGLMPRTILERTTQILQSIRKSVVVVKLSLDGLGPDHDALRGRPGSFEKVLETFALLRPLQDRFPNFELGLNTVFCSANQLKIFAIIEFVRRLGKAGTHTLSMVRGDLINARFLETDLRQYRKAADLLEARFKNRQAGLPRFRGGRLKAAQDILQRRLIYRTLVQKQKIIDCCAGRLNLVLTEGGAVYPCELATEPLGNIREHAGDARALLRSPRAARAIRNIRSSGCFCSHECHFLTHILFSLKSYPALLWHYLRI